MTTTTTTDPRYSTALALAEEQVIARRLEATLDAFLSGARTTD